jgi:glucose-6-phosphate 1-epimerase
LITYKELANNYKYIEIKNEEAEAKIALQGGHIFHYKTDNNKPLLWLSKSAIFKEEKAIRGGIPICFPWFGPHATDSSFPQHGFARTALWEVVRTKEESNSTEIELKLESTEAYLTIWAHMFDVRLIFTIGKELTLVLSVKNTDTKPFTFTTALHSYFNVSDISQVLVTGLNKASYEDSLTGKIRVQEGDLVIDQEVDRVYFDASSTVTIEEGRDFICLKQRGSNSLVVWNPWVKKAKALADMPDEGYKTMLCLETGNVRKDERTLQPNEVHVLALTISSNALAFFTS